MKAVEFHPDAAEEAREAALHYEDIRAGLGADFRADLDAALARIGDNPLMYASGWQRSDTTAVAPGTGPAAVRADKSGPEPDAGVILCFC
jgi:hypothetical protein